MVGEYVVNDGMYVCNSPKQRIAKPNITPSTSDRFAVFDTNTQSDDNTMIDKNNENDDENAEITVNS